ncbi:mitochondrial import inner membrane translocase subunit TIM50-like isoform X2 [Tasmannia lanceolata]|uniref:mitochondrial import inner membrane translocase subunit TIM50-like isoform X2 n=1 Tax=Tasmannia lanceolata TaxID=3420 RepID=UPI0040635E24
MSQIIRSRLFSHLSKNRNFCSNISTNPTKEPLISTASHLNDQSQSLPTETKGKKSWNFLKFMIFGALTGASATAGYATYAYTLEEVDYKTRALHESANYTVGDDASALDKLQAILYSTAMKVPAKSVELYMDIRRSLEEKLRGFTEPSSEKLLPDLHPLEQHVFTLVLDLNETLIYSDWKRDRGWRTFKRPGVDDFLKHLSNFYEIVVYSDQQDVYVDPIVERLDKEGRYVRYRLSRPATRYVNGNHYRDLSKLNRDPSRILYVSGHALESSLQPENGVPIKPWKLEPDDTALLDLIPFLEYVAQHRPADIRIVLASYQGHDIATEFAERSKEYQRMQEQKRQGRFWGR